MGLPIEAAPGAVRLAWLIMFMKTITSLFLLLAFFGCLSAAPEDASKPGQLEVTVGPTHHWNQVSLPPSQATRESYWSFSHSLEFTVPETYQPGMVFLCFLVIEEGEYLRSWEFHKINGEGDLMSGGAGTPIVYTAPFSGCTFRDAPATASTRQFRLFSLHHFPWSAGDRFRLKLGFAKQISFHAKAMVSFVKTTVSPSDMGQIMPLVGLQEMPIFGEWIASVNFRGLRLLQNEHRLVAEKDEPRMRGMYRCWAVNNGPVYPANGEGVSHFGSSVDTEDQHMFPPYSKISGNPWATPAGVEEILGKPDFVMSGAVYERATRYPATDGMLSDLSERWMYFYDLVALITAPGKKDGPFEWVRVATGPMMPLRFVPEKGFGFTRLGDTNAYGFFKDRELKTTIVRFGRRPEKAELFGGEPEKVEYVNLDCQRSLVATASYLGEGRWKWAAIAPDGVSVELRDLTNHKFEGRGEIRGRDDTLLGESTWRGGMPNGKAWWSEPGRGRVDEDYRWGRLGYLSGDSFYFSGYSGVPVPE